MEPLVEMHAIIYGNVQGVGFRYTTKLIATELGLTGTVRNLPDGRSVEIFAQGSKEILESLIAKLEESMGQGCIHNTDVTLYSPKKAFSGFHIVF